MEVRNSEGTPFRNYGLLELDNLKPETKNSDVGVLMAFEARRALAKVLEEIGKL